VVDKSGVGASGNITDYQEPVEKLPVIFYSVKIEADGKIFSRYISPYVQQVMGYLPQEFSLPQSLWRDIIHPEDKERVFLEVQNAIKNHLTLNMEYRLKAKDERWVWIQDRAVIHYQSDGSITLQGTWMDITSLKEEASYSFAQDTQVVGPYENLPVGYQSLDYEGHILEVNSTWLKMLGYQKWEILGHWFGDFLGEPQEDIFRARFQKFKELGQVNNIEFLMKKKDGSCIPVSFTGRIRRDSKGNFLKTHCVMQDISQRKAVEQQLLESEEKFSRIFMINPDLILIARLADGVIMDTNDSFLQNTGYSREEVIGKTALELNLWAEPDKRKLFIESIERTGECLGFEVVLQTREGKHIHILLSGRITEVHGIPCVISIARDITGLKKAEEDRRKLETQILQSQKLESLGVLAGGIAHDFNNLLTGILGNAELLRQDLPPLSSEFARVKQIEIAAQRAADLTRQMLAYAGKGKLHTQNIHFPDLLSQLDELINVSLGKYTQLKIELGGDLPLIHGDAAQIQQLIMNLVINASEAIHGKEGTIRLNVYSGFLQNEALEKMILGKELAEGDYICLEIEDNGVGMSAEVKEKMFEPFFSTKFTGRGLGLSAALGIVRSHKGAMQVESWEGKGTRIKVYFPASHNGVEGSAALQEKVHAGSVLLIDDEEMVMTLTRRFIEKAGYKVVESTNAQAAISVFSRSPKEFCLAIIDINLPGMNGFLAADQLRTLNPELRLLFSSGLFTEEDYLRQRDISNSAMIQKPYRYQQIVEKIDSLLES